RSVVRGESSAAQRRELDYASAQHLYKASYSSRPQSACEPRCSSISSGQHRSRHMSSITIGIRSLSRQKSDEPPLPKTSSRFIGWRSSVPELRLERY
ncbi:hypothetical protein SK128_013646, partial [Halocaridina rubra]